MQRESACQSLPRSKGLLHRASPSSLVRTTPCIEADALLEMPAQFGPRPVQPWRRRQEHSHLALTASRISDRLAASTPDLRPGDLPLSTMTIVVELLFVQTLTPASRYCDRIANAIAWLWREDWDLDRLRQLSASWVTAFGRWRSEATSSGVLPAFLRCSASFPASESLTCALKTRQHDDGRRLLRHL
jgi:hypothetical protein